MKTKQYVGLATICTLLLSHNFVQAGGGDDCGIRVHHCIAGDSVGDLEATIYNKNHTSGFYVRRKTIKKEKWRRLECNDNRCDLLISYSDYQKWKNNTCESDFTVHGLYLKDRGVVSGFEVLEGKGNYGCNTTKQN